MKKSDFERLTALCSLILLFSYPLSGYGAGVEKVRRIVDKEKYVDKFYQIDDKGQERINIFLGNENFAFVSNDKIYFNLNDHLGSPTIITDSVGQLAELNDYDDFGKVINENSSINNDYKFLHNELDTEINLSYFDNRYYDSSLARFTSLDPLLLQNPQIFLRDPQQLNSYSYGRNNPISLLDKDGNKVSEFQPYYSSSGFYDYGQAYGNYRSIDIISAGEKSGDGDHPYQCVDLFQRFTDKQYGLRVSGLWHAMKYGQQKLLDTAYGNSDKNFTVYENGGSIMPQENDAITWTHNDGVGHIGVIVEVSFDEKTNSGYVYSMEQNYSGYQSIYTQELHRSYDKNGQPIYSLDNRGNYIVQSWVRYNKQESIPYSNILYTPATGNYIKN